MKDNVDKARLQNIIIILLVQSFLLLALGSWERVKPFNIFYEELIPVALVFVIGLSILSIILVKDLYELSKERTEIKVKEVKLKEKEKLINELRSQKHDFSNHLQTIYGMVQLKKNEEVKEYIQSLNQELKSYNLKKGQRKNALLESVLVPLKKEAEKAGIDFECRVKKGIKTIDCPLSKFVRIISNLIENAVEATKTFEGEKLIKVIGEKEQSTYKIIVYNSGPAIDNELKEKVFTPGISTKGDNRGFGLYIIKSLVEEVGGELKVKSKEGFGTQFTCYLPREGVDR